MGAARRRFLKHVQKTPTCWLWTGAFYTQFGQPTYGQFYLNGKLTGAHRASYILFVGPIPDGLDILHSCDVKACVNPADLHPGTHKENLAEARERNGEWRVAPSGEEHGRARLTWPQVHAIRAAAAQGTKQNVLADQYAVSRTQIGHIVNNRRWVNRESVA